MNDLERTTAEKLADFVIDTFSEQNRRVRVEDVISAAAAITAEQCIAVAGQFSVNHHTRPPGGHAFSDRINELLFGDREEDVAAFPDDSVLGILRARDQASPPGQERRPKFAALAPSFGRRQTEPLRPFRSNEVLGTNVRRDWFRSHGHDSHRVRLYVGRPSRAARLRTNH